MNPVFIIMQLLHKSVNQFSLYGSAHPQTIASVDELHKRVSEYLSLHQSLEFEVFRESFLFNKDPVFTLEKKENNYIYEMYIDGVRKMTFVQGVDTKELFQLCSILSRDLGSYEMKEEDTVTLLWKQSFEHIRHETLDIYEGDMNAMLRELFSMEDQEEENEEQLYLRQFVTKLVSPDESSPAMQSCARSTDSYDSISMPQYMLILDDSAQVPLVEKPAIPAQLSHLPLLITEMIERKPEHPDLPLFIRLCVFFVSERLGSGGNLREIQLWIDVIVHLRGSISRKLPVYHATQVALKAISSKHAIERLAKNYGKSITGTLEDLTHYFGSLGEYAPSAICEFLRHTVQEAIHASLVDFLIEKHAHAVDTYREYLKLDDSFLISDMIRVLSHAMPSSQFTDLVRPLSFHPDLRVRMAVLLSTLKMPLPSAIPILHRSLRDKEEEIRIHALQLFFKIKSTDHLSVLKSEINKREFHSKSQQEQMAFVVAFIRLAEKPALVFLKHLLELRTDQPNMQVAVLKSLKVVGSDLARQVVEIFVDKKWGDRTTRETAASILHTWRKKQ